MHDGNDQINVSLWVKQRSMVRTELDREKSVLL